MDLLTLKVEGRSGCVKSNLIYVVFTAGTGRVLRILGFFSTIFAIFHSDVTILVIFYSDNLIFKG